MGRRINQIIIFTFGLLHSFNSNCQTSGNLYFFVSPENSIVRLDTSLYQQKKEIVSMPPGTYIVKIWAPKRKLLTDTLVVKEKGITFFRRKLSFTDEYKSYRQKIFAYKTLKGIMRYALIPATAIMALHSYSDYKNHSDNADYYLEQANNIRNGFSALLTIDQVNIARERFEYCSVNYDEEIESANKKMKQTQLIIGSGIILTSVLNYCTKFLHKPSYSETPLLSDVSIGVNQFNAVCLSIHLNISEK